MNPTSTPSVEPGTRSSNDSDDSSIVIDLHPHAPDPVAPSPVTPDPVVQPGPVAPPEESLPAPVPDPQLPPAPEAVAPISATQPVPELQPQLPIEPVAPLDPPTVIEPIQATPEPVPTPSEPAVVASPVIQDVVAPPVQPVAPPPPATIEVPKPAPASAFATLEPDPLPQQPPAPQPITAVDASQWFQSNAPVQETVVSANFAQPAGLVAEPMVVQGGMMQPAPAIAAAVDPTPAVPIQPAAAPDPFSVQATDENPNKSYLIALLLAYFFGFLGVDRFYLGKTKTAIAKLLTVGGLGFWIAIDLVRIGWGKNRAVDDQRPLEGFSRNYSWVKIVSIIVAVVNFAIPALIFVIIMIAQTIQLNQRQEDFTERTSQSQTAE